MADPVFQRRIELGGGLLQLSYEKERVVAESIRTARRAGDLAVPESFGDQGAFVLRVSCQNHDAGVMRLALVLQGGEELRIVASVARLAVAFAPGVVGRVHAG